MVIDFNKIDEFYDIGVVIGDVVVADDNYLSVYYYDKDIKECPPICNIHDMGVGRTELFRNGVKLIVREICKNDNGCIFIKVSCVNGTNYCPWFFGKCFNVVD
jgi:nitrogen fixation protein